MAEIPYHYDEFLADYYSWMFGDFEEKTQANYDYFLSKKLIPGQSTIAFDLGAGSGFQSIALARLGFNVTAIDLCSKLLDELKSKSGKLPIRTIKDNLLKIANYSNAEAELVTCMGDTLTHLPSVEKVEALFREVHRSLMKEGRFVLTFRDYSHALEDAEQIIPVRSDKNTIFTCFLEYEPDRVKVFDIVYENLHGQWHMRKSFYYKLRISPTLVETLLTKTGFMINTGKTGGGMTEVVARKMS